MKLKKEFEVIEVEASGNACWMKGAWCLVWVYSTKGNFLLKGYYGECKDYIDKQNFKCWAVFNLYSSKSKSYNNKKGFRTIISTFNCDFSISRPSQMSRIKNKEGYRFRVRREEKVLYLKRLPQQFTELN